jgi:hypothetical protein
MFRRVIRVGTTTIVQHGHTTHAGEWRSEEEAERMYRLFVGVAVSASEQEEQKARS